MYEPGNIIYFKPFYFKNGNTSKEKYFIVLKVIDGISVIASLPTRKNEAPSFVTQHGCTEIPERCINCYCFKKDKVITTNGWSFPLDTHIYGNQVEKYEIMILESVYKEKDTDYEIIGRLVKHEFDSLIECFKNSSSTKRGIKALL